MMTARAILKTGNIDPETPPSHSLPGNADQLINAEQLRRMIPVTDMTIWRWTRDCGFPKPMKLNGGRRLWRLAEVHEWLRSRDDRKAENSTDQAA